MHSQLVVLEAPLVACPQSHTVSSPGHVESQALTPQAEGSTACPRPVATCVRERVHSDDFSPHDASDPQAPIFPSMPPDLFKCRGQA